MNIITRTATCPPLPGPAGDCTDALSAPTGDTLLEPTLALLPRGAAWRTDEVADAGHTSFLHRFWRAVVDPVADLYGKAWEMCMQSTACTVDSGLEDWERDYGLPDTCAIVEFSQANRLTKLRAKVAAEGGGRPADMICLAASLGYEVAIEEPRFFEFGRSAFNSGGIEPFYFEFGVSAFGDRFSDFTGTPAGLTDQFGGNVLVKHFEFGYSAFGDGWGSRFTDFPEEPPVWLIVHVIGATATYFEFGFSAFGDRFSDFNPATDLECAIRRDAPAHTIPVFDYADDLPVA